MGKYRSFVDTIEIDIAATSHNCRFNKIHRISKGDKRLKVKKDRGHDHYCIACAKVFVEKDIFKLNELKAQLENLV